MAHYWFGMLRFSSLVLFLLLSFRTLHAADEAELFSQASKAFQDKFYERAEQQFGEVVAAFPESTNLATAILMQGQARFFQRRYEAAIELLRSNLSKAGPQADQFTFWIAEAFRELGNHSSAAENYASLLAAYPHSPLALRASYLEALSLFHLKEYARAADLLQDSEKPFPKLSSAAAGDPVSLRGRLLLAETLLASGKADEARDTLNHLALTPEQTELVWEKNQLLARVNFVGANPAAALASLSNSIAIAQAARRPLLEVQSRSLEADVYRKLNRPADAVAAYERIGTIEGLPVDQKRLALLKTVELLSTIGNRTNALTRLENYLTTQTNEPAADLLHLKAGELWVEEFRQLSADLSRNHSAATNALSMARSHLGSVLAFTNSTHVGRAWLSLGWCHWEEAMLLDRPARVPDSEQALRNASQKLMRSDDQATAFFKIADALLYQGRPEAARSNYLAVVRNYTDLPQVKNALLDKAFRQLVRTSIELKDFDAAKSYLGELRTAFPNSVLTEETLYQFGQALAAAGRTADARAAFQDFLQNYPGAALGPEVRFAEARTYAAEGSLDLAIQKHEEWLRTFATNTLRGRVKFRKAVLVDRSGQRTNAFALFTNFVAQFPTHKLAPAAQSWVADYYFGLEEWPQAERNYQRIFQNTNWATSALAYEARLMAAKTAFKRQGYNDARHYLTNLINALSANPRAPAQLIPEAYFVLGDVFLEEPITGTTNKFQNFLEAAKVFDFIAAQYPSNKLAVLALGKKGDCHLQLASSPNFAESYAVATNCYLKVLNSPIPDVPMSVRNQAEVGLGVALKNLAETRPAEAREALQKAALDRFLNVVYSGDNGEPPDPYYLKLAGLEAGRLAESLGNSTAALQLYRRLLKEAPALKSLWEAKITSLQQRISVANR